MCTPSSGAFKEVDGDLTGAGSQVHAVIESDLDVLMLQLKRNGATVADYPPVGELVTNARIDKVAGALMSFVASSVYGLSVGANEYGGAVADMQLAYRMIEPAGSLRSMRSRVWKAWSKTTRCSKRSGIASPPKPRGSRQSGVPGMGQPVYAACEHRELPRPF